MYFCHGKLMTFKQVCAKAIELHEIYGYQDPECGRIIATQECDGHIPALGYGGANSVTPTQSANSMSPAQNNMAAGINNNMGFTQGGPVTPTKDAQGNPILFGPFNTSGGTIGSGQGFYTDSSSPTPFGMGRNMNMTSPVYKSSNAYMTPPDFSSPIKYGKKATVDFDTYLVDKGVGNTGGSMGSGAGKTQAFDAAAYSHHVLAGPVTAHAGKNSGSSMGTGHVANMPNDIFAGNIWNGNSGNAASGPDLGSSATTKDSTVAQDTPTAPQSSTSDLKQAQEPAVDDHNDLHFDAQFDEFLEFASDGSDGEEAAFPN